MQTLTLPKELQEKSDIEVLKDEYALIQSYPILLSECEFLTIKTKTEQLIKLKLNSVQKIIIAIIKKLLKEKRPIRLLILKARQMGVCGSPEMRILTSDLRWVKLRDIQIGQKIISTDEFAKDGRGNGRKLKTAVVESKKSIFELAYKLKMDDGRGLIFTPEHRLLSKRNGSTETIWKKVKDFEVGNEIRYITKPWKEGNFEDGWFGGIIDGEGSLRFINHTGVEVCVVQNPGSLFDKMRDYAKKNNYNFGIEIDGRRNSDGNTAKFGDSFTNRVAFSRMNEVFRLVGQTRPKRFIGVEWWAGKDLPGKKSGIGWSKIIEIEPLKQQEMIDLQTSAKTFIAEGFVSHNSTLIQSIIYAFTSQKQGRNALVVADDIKGANYIFEMQKLFHECLDEHLKPKLKHSNEKKLEFAGIHSQVLIDTAENPNMGRKFTLQYAHLSEAAFFKGLNNIMKGVSQCIPNAPGTMVILETTANGVGGDFYDRWEEAKKGKSDWLAIFIPWFELPEYTLQLENNEFYPIDNLKSDKGKFVKAEIALKKKFNLTDGQINWRRWCIINNCNGEVNTFMQEYPSTDLEAFIMSGDLYFDRDALLKQEDKSSALKEKGFPKIGDIVRLDNMYQFRECEDGKFRVYEYPNREDQYAIGADSAEGLAHGDNSAAICLNKKTNKTACAYSCQADSDDFAVDLIKMGSWYNMATIAPENKGYGTSVCKKVFAHYGNIYHKIRDKTGEIDVTDELGWNTNSVTRPQMLGQLREEIAEDSTDLFDGELLAECRTFINNPKKKRPEAEAGKRDDLIFARAIAGMVRIYYPNVSRRSIEDLRKNSIHSRTPAQNQGMGFKKE